MSVFSSKKVYALTLKSYLFTTVTVQIVRIQTVVPFIISWNVQLPTVQTVICLFWRVWIYTVDLKENQSN